MTHIPAMACWVPVVSPRSGLAPQCVPDAAAVLEPGRDSELLAEAIVQILSNQSRRR